MSSLSALQLSGFLSPLIAWGCSVEWCSSLLSFSLSVSVPLAGPVSLQPVLWVLLPWRTLIQHLSMTRLIIWNCWASGLFWMWLWWPNNGFPRWLHESDVIFHPVSTILPTFSSQKALTPTWSRLLAVSQSRPAYLCSLPPPLLGNHGEKWLFCSLIESVWERLYFYHLIILFAAQSVDKIVIILTREQCFSAWDGNASYRAAILHNSHGRAMGFPVSYNHGMEQSSSPSCLCTLAAKMYSSYEMGKTFVACVFCSRVHNVGDLRSTSLFGCHYIFKTLYVFHLFPFSEGKN